MEKKDILPDRLDQLVVCSRQQRGVSCLLAADRSVTVDIDRSLPLVYDRVLVLFQFDSSGFQTGYYYGREVLCVDSFRNASIDRN